MDPFLMVAGGGEFFLVVGMGVMDVFWMVVGSKESTLGGGRCWWIYFGSWWVVDGGIV